MIGRRGWTWRDGYVFAVFIGLLAYCLGPSVIGLNTLLPVNLLSNFYPWVAQHGSDLSGHFTCGGDTVDSMVPGYQHLRSQLFAGHLANWEAVTAGGSQLAAQPNSGLLDPLSLPYWFMPLWLAPAFVILLQTVVAAGGTFLFLRQFRVSRAAATLAGLVFATSGFMVMWNNWPQARVAALIPALFWAVERAVRRLRLRDAALIAVVVASLLLGGFPSVTLYAIYMATAYLVVRVVILYREEIGVALRVVAVAAAGLVIGVVLSMVQMLPFLYFYSQSNLAYRSGDAKAGLPISGLLTLFAPNSYGLCIAGHPTRGTTNPVELVAYIGSAALVLAVTAVAFAMWRGRGPERRAVERRGLVGYFAAACVVVILLGWVSPGLRSVVAGLPPFAGNFIGRIRSVLGFGLAVLAAIGFDWLTARADDQTDPAPAPPDYRSRRVVWAAAVWVLVAGFGVLVLRDAHRAAFSGGYWVGLRNALVLPAVLLGVALLVVAIGSAWRRPGTRTFAFVVIPLLVAVQAGQFFHTVMPGDNKADFYPDTPTHRFLAAHLGPDRFASTNRTMYTATGLYYDLRTPTGHEFEEPQWEDLLKTVDPGVMNTPTFADFTGALTTSNVGNQPILDRMAVKYFVQPPSAVAGRVEPVPAAQGTVPAASRSAACSLPSQPIRGVSFRVAGLLTATDRARGITLDVTVRRGGTTLTSAQWMGPIVPAGQTVTIGLAGESLPSGAGTLSVSFSARGAGQPLQLAAGGGTAVCAPVLPAADGLELVFADAGSVVYQRMTAMPRVRWATATDTIPTSKGQLAALEGGLPASVVVLDSPGPKASGQPATITLLKDLDDTLSARVDARGGGYLVVADALQQPGWTARLDGRKATLRPADHAMVAVYVPAGTHTVTLSYAPPGQITGLALSGVGLVGLIGVIAVPAPIRRRRPGGRPGPGPGGPGADG